MDWILSSIVAWLNAVLIKVLLGFLYLQFHFFEAIRNNPFIILYVLFAIYVCKWVLVPLFRIVKWLFNLWRRRNDDENY